MRSLRFWLSIAVSLVFLWLAFRNQDLSATANALTNADYRLVLPAIGLYFVGVWVRSARWKALLSPLGRHSAASLFPVVVIGYMANDVLPARMGEVVRVYVLNQRAGVPKTSALGTVVVERLLDAITMLLLLAVAALLVPLNGVVRNVSLLASVVLLAGLIPLLLLVFRPQLVVRVLAAFSRRLPVPLVARLSSAGGGFLSGLRVVRSSPAVSAALALSVVAWLFEGGMYWLLAVGFDLPVGVGVILLTLAVANLATLVPAGPGYVGSFEVGALLVLSGLAGIDLELATGYVLVVHAALVIPVILLGLYYWGAHHLSLSRIRRDVELTRRQGNPAEIRAFE